MTNSKTHSKSRNRSQTYTSSFDVSVCMGPLLFQEYVCKLFKEILHDADARIKIRGLTRKNCSFSYGVPDEGLAKISGILHE